MEILFVRHGEDQGTAKGIIADLGLTESGIKQCLNLKNIVRKFQPDFVISSPLKRAIETAEIVTEGTNLEIEVNTLLIEMNYNDLENINQRELIEFNNKLDTNKGYIEKSKKFKGGESHNDLIIRVKTFWKEFEMINIHKLSIFLIIAHGRILTFLISYIMDLELDGYRFAIPNAGYLKLLFHENWRPQVEFCVF